SYPPGPPVVSSSPIAQIQFGLRFQRAPLTVLSDWHHTYGDVFHLQIGADFHQYFFIHPDDIHTVLVAQSDKFHKSPDYRDEQRGLARFLGSGLLTSDGDFWKRQRKLAQPAFHTQRIDAYAQTMVDYTQRMLAEWQDGERRDIRHAMMRLTRLIVAKTLFDADVTADSSRVDDALNTFMRMSNDTDLIPSWVPTPKHLRERRAVSDLDEIIYGFVAEWRRQGIDRGDLLSMLLLAEDDQGQGMTDKQVRDEVVTLFLAGHETTANALNWTWMLLAQHSEVEAKLHAELDRVLDGRPPTLADLRALTYTDWVIKESMRLYPPAWGFGRQAIDDVEVGGYRVPRGTVVSILPYLTHRDPAWWGADAEAFRPERWSADPPHKYAYIPFGGGPHVCIGNSFATMEARLLLATIAQQVQLRLDPGQKVEMEPLITLRPRGGLPMKLAQRR
ncbi:MAG: cytochrome P450, partial [Anaerolineae bacterium]|nr:cytochrome P450 [Anaerolineae bacterium]